MKKSILMLLGLSMFALANGMVNVEVPLYITDVNGVTDTLVLAINENATHGVDAELGEVAINDSELQTELSGDRFALVAIEYKRNGIWEEYTFGHKAVVNSAREPGDAFIVAIAENRYPIHVTWNPLLLQEELTESFITDWVPGGWFDAVYGWEDLKDMATESEISFDFHLDNYIYFESIDTKLGLFYVSLTDHKYTLAISNTTSAPTPSKLIKDGQLFFQMDEQIYDVMGRKK